VISPRGVRVAIAGLALAASAACMPGRSPAGGLNPCTAPGADTTGWTVVDAGPFRFAVPNDYQRRKVQGIDSHVGWWSAPGRSVHFDWGMYSSTLDESATLLRDRAECTTEIGGHPAKVVGGFDAEGRWEEQGRKYVVAATWRDVQPGTHLTLSVTSADPSDVPVLVRIIQSVRFKPGEPTP